MAVTRDSNVMDTGQAELVVASKGGGLLIQCRPVFTRDSETIFLACGKKILMYKISTGDCFQELQCHENEVVGLTLHPQKDDVLVSCDKKGMVVFWNFNIGSPAKTLQLHKSGYDVLEMVSFFMTLVGCGKSGAKMYGTIMGYGEEAQLEVFNANGVAAHRNIIDRNLLSIHNNVDFGCDGEYFAAIGMRTLYVHEFHESRSKRHLTPKDRPFTCVACHKNEYCVATGDTSGRIQIWRNIFDTSPTKERFHWHQLPVQDIVFSAEGSYFYSGGEECVLVKWQLDSEYKKVLPRVGLPIKHIAVSPENIYTALSTCDNAVSIIDAHFNPIQMVQGMVQHWAPPGKKRSPAGIITDPLNDAIIMNGRPGHLQFYNVQKRKYLYTLDITKRNFITRERHKEMSNTEVVRVAMSSNGTWLATAESREDLDFPELRLKYWRFQDSSQNFKLNTSVESPHEDKLIALKFLPKRYDTFRQVAATTGGDKKLKIWSIDDEMGKGQHWKCECVITYKGLMVSDATFSPDGTAIGVGFASIFTIWDASSLALKASMTHVKLRTDIRQIEFGRRQSSQTAVTVMEDAVSAWDLLSLSLLWTVNVCATHLCVDPLSQYMAVFGKRNLFVFTPNDPTPVFQRKKVSDSAILAAVFVPRRHREGYEGLWCSESALYFINENQMLYTVEREDEVEEEFSDGAESAPSQKPLTFFSATIAQQQKSDVQESQATWHHQTRNIENATLKEILSGPSHTLPPLNTLAEPYLRSLVTTIAGCEEEMVVEEEVGQKRSKAEVPDPRSGKQWEVDSGLETGEEDVSNASIDVVSLPSSSQSSNKSAEKTGGEALGLILEEDFAFLAGLPSL